MNKKGFELAWNTFVTLILAIVVLVAVIMFFTGGFKTVTETIGSYFTNSNVDSVIGSCNYFVDSNQDYKFCCEKMKVKYYIDGKKASEEFTCMELTNKTFTGNKIKLLDCDEMGC